MNIEQSSGQGDEKVMDIQIEKEMVAYFIMKNRKKRTQWELESTRKRDEGISRFINGTYLDSKLFIPIQDRNSKNVLSMIKKMGGTDKAYVMSSSSCEYVSAKEGVLLGQYYECMFIYFGSGIAYYHEEWEGGSKGEYILNGKTKG